MSFFHVLASTNDNPESQKCLFADLSERDLKNLFVAPYKKGEGVLCGNDVVQTSNLKTVNLIRTPQKMEEELVSIQAKSNREIDEFNRESQSVVLISPGRGYVPEDIVEAGEDVTGSFLLGPPGHAKSNWFVRIVNNPWVVRVGGGVIAAIIIWWFGWR